MAEQGGFELPVSRETPAAAKRSVGLARFRAIVGRLEGCREGIREIRGIRHRMEPFAQRQREIKRRAAHAWLPRVLKVMKLRFYAARSGELFQ
jgi:hypothetical protein